MTTPQNISDNILFVDIQYPRSPDAQVKKIEVNLEDVRAADGIRISYDFDRDGWVIEQASIFEWEEGETDFDMDWQEVAFVQAWGRKKE